MEIYLGDWSELKRTRAVSFIYNARIRVKNLEFNFKLGSYEFTEVLVGKGQCSFRSRGVVV